MLVAVASAGCAASDAYQSDTEDFIDMPTPPGQCSAGTGAEPCPNATETSNPGQPAGGPCLEPDDCQAGLGCAAPYQDGELGEFTCRDQCIELDDQASWCLDGAACCDPTATCRRGLCVIDEVADASTGADGSSDGGTEGSGSDTGSGSSGGSGSGTTGMQ